MTTADSLPTAYDPAGVEQRLYADWESAGLFHAEPDDPGEPFSIVIPPPNVTGRLHVGHALTNTIEDAMVRHARMAGRNAVWVPGMDHAGIATQTVVERALAEEGLSRHDLGREAFLERVWEWVEHYGGVILDQLRRLGASLDWEREAFTFDEQRSVAVTEVFVALHEQGLLYRGNRLINWCPSCMTALSDIEVDHAEVEGTLTDFTYPWAEPADDDESPGIVVATTRPETMLGDTAIAVHPDDERHAHLVGREVAHPFLDRRLPVIADDWVDPEFGSGAVKVTPAHDPNDFDIGERHDLESVTVIGLDATMGEEAGPFAGMERFAARDAVVAALDERGLLVGSRAHTHQVGHCSRSGDVVEPLLSDQWFLEVRPLADKALAAVHDGDTRVMPPRLQRFFVEWLEGLHDWCVSRQLWWGHRIPAWYCPDGHVTVARSAPTSCGTCGTSRLEQDEDVLDTWFSSQLWPFTVFGWQRPGDSTPELEAWYPTTVMETGYDINTFWVSRMLQVGLWFLDEVPFRTIWNHGMVRDQYGKKMSKSWGNVIDPMEFIESHGADALRLALFQHCSPGTDVPLSADWVEGARRFLNKLFNATRFALQTLDDVRPGDLPAADELRLADRWVLSRLEATRASVDEHYETWDWARMSAALYRFTWDELADWYLESAKVVLYGDDEGAKAATRAVLARVLDDLLRMWHPLIPFVTEELWRHLTGASGGAESLMVAAWPEQADQRRPDDEADMAVIVDFVTEVRRFRSLNDVAPSRRFGVTVASDRADLLVREQALVCALAGLDHIELVDELVAREGTSSIVFARGEAQVELAGLIDVAAEVERLERELAKAADLLARSTGKLANENFVARAPADVVAAERARRDDTQRLIAELEQRVASLSRLVPAGGAGT